MPAEEMPPGRNRLVAAQPERYCRVAERQSLRRRAKVSPPGSRRSPGRCCPPAGRAETGSGPLGGIPPDEFTQTAPIQRGGMSGTVRRSRIATPKAGAVRITWTGPPGTPRVGASVKTIGCGEFVMFIAETTVFHSVDGVPVLERHADDVVVAWNREGLSELFRGDARGNRERLVVAHEVLGNAFEVREAIRTRRRLARRRTDRRGRGEYQGRPEEAAPAAQSRPRRPGSGQSSRPRRSPPYRHRRPRTSSSTRRGSPACGQRQCS